MRNNSTSGNVYHSGFVLMFTKYIIIVIGANAYLIAHLRESNLWVPRINGRKVRKHAMAG